MPFLPSSEPQPAALQNRWLQRFWPWLILFCLLITAVWEYRVFDRGFDSEYPTLVRNTYNPLPPAVYRLAEPGDTLDRAALYAAAAGFVASLNGWWMSWKKNRSSALWPVAAALLLAAGWHAATPWPTFDGWYGWNWYSHIHSPDSECFSVRPHRLVSRLDLCRAEEFEALPRNGLAPSLPWLDGYWRYRNLLAYGSPARW